MSDWLPIETAPKDGTVIRYKRMFEGRKAFDGKACWRTVHFKALYDPLTGKEFSAAEDTTGWMLPPEEGDFRAPEPTHWMPLPEEPPSFQPSPNSDPI